MKIEDYIAERFRKEGVKRFFGIPGGPSIPYMEAFRRAGIEFILTGHEGSAAVMADVTARLTGVTGVCHATFGPGAVNLASGVGGALLDRSPVIALTTEMTDAWLGRTAQMNIDHQGLFRPLTKATFRLSSANAGDVISRSLELANDEYPGPVHIGLPSDLAGRELTSGAFAPQTSHEAPARSQTGEGTTAHSRTGEGIPAAARTETGSGVSAAARPDARAVITGIWGSDAASAIHGRAGVLIASARRPLLAVGLTAMRNGAGQALVKFLEEHSVPVIVTPMAKAMIPADHPCFAGVFFHALSDRLERLIKAADLVIGLGYDPVEYNYESWLPDVPLISFDTRPSDLSVRGSIEIVSPPGRWFEILAPLMSSPEMTGMAGEVRADILKSLAAPSNGFSPVAALSVLRETLPPGSTVTADVGSHLHLLGQMWDVMNGRLIMTNGWSSMGFGLPAAVAAALACSGEPVVCITGDGGLLMHAGEIMTARRLGLRIITVVLNDGELNLIRVKQQWKNVSPYGIKVSDGLLFGADSFLGVDVKRVINAAELRSAVRKSLRSESSVIIEAVVNPSLYSDLVVRS